MSKLNNKSLEELNKYILEELKTPTSDSIFNDQKYFSLLDENNKEIKKIDIDILKNADKILDKSFEDYYKLLDDNNIKDIPLKEILLNNYKELLILQISIIFEKSIELFEKNSNNNDIIKNKIIDFIDKFKNKINSMNQYIKFKTKLNNQNNQKKKEEKEEKEKKEEKGEKEKKEEEVEEEGEKEKKEGEEEKKEGEEEEEEFIITEDNEEENQENNKENQKEYLSLDEVKKEIQEDLENNLNKNKETKDNYKIDINLLGGLKDIDNKYYFVDIIKPRKKENTYSVDLLSEINKNIIKDYINKKYELYGKKIMISNNKKEGEKLELNKDFLQIKDLTKNEIPKDINNKDLINIIQKGGRGFSFEYVLLLEKK